MTHADVWKNDRSKINYLRKQQGNNPYKIALTGNFHNEDEKDAISKILNEEKINTSNLIIGCNDLRDFLINELKNKINVLRPIIKENISSLKTILAQHFDEIGGRKEPNLKDICNLFRDKASDEFEKIPKNIDINKRLRDTEEKIKPEHIKGLVEFMFKNMNAIKQSIAEDIKNSDRNCVEGTEGYDMIVKKYIIILLNNLKPMIDTYIDTHFFLINVNMEGLFREMKKIYQSTDFLNNQQRIMSEEIEKIKNIKKNDINEHFKNIELRPYVSDNHISLTSRDEIIIKEMFKCAFKNEAEAKSYIKNKLNEQHSNIYLNNAQCAIDHVIQIWKRLSTSLNETIVPEIRRSGDDLIKQTKRHFIGVSEENFSNNNEKELQRTQLLSCEECIDQLLQSIDKVF